MLLVRVLVRCGVGLGRAGGDLGELWGSMHRGHLRLACAALLCLRSCTAFYLPGVAPQDYARVGSSPEHSEPKPPDVCLGSRGGVQGDKEVIKVNKLTSIKTQLPYEYYSIPYCQPESIKSSAENLGEVLRGDRIENSLYEARMRVVAGCTLEGLSRD